MPDKQIFTCPDQKVPRPDCCRSLSKLLAFLGLDPERAPFPLLEQVDFPVIIPESYLYRIKKGEWYDPLLLQVLPRAEEATRKEGFTGDPVGDARSEVVPGLLYKYASRALVLISNQCAVHCRFCFRRDQAVRAPEEHCSVFDHLSRRKEITEIILSGGDPLCMEAGELERNLERIAGMPHIRTVRIHTRLPIVDPERLDERMIGLFAAIAAVKTCVVVVHANHAAEITGNCPLCLTRLRATGALLLNQSVLLRGVNDSVETLVDLSQTLIAHGVFPYYLHQLDRAAGTWHFEVKEEQGRELIREMRLRLPGYAVPRYVREVAGERAKKVLI